MNFINCFEVKFMKHYKSVMNSYCILVAIFKISGKSTWICEVLKNEHSLFEESMKIY